jgi:membrane protein implicated in regulation of membrane protease activity
MSSLQWVILAIVCGVVEIATSGFWFLWLAISGLLVALGVSIRLLPSLESQLLVFALFTLIFIIFTRPLVMRFFKTTDTASNVDALIGQHGLVTSRIDPLHYGQVKVNGEIWTAASAEDLEPNTRVVVKAIDGVKLVVAKAAE